MDLVTVDIAQFLAQNLYFFAFFSKFFKYFQKTLLFEKTLLLRAARGLPVKCVMQNAECSVSALIDQPYSNGWSIRKSFKDIQNIFEKISDFFQNQFSSRKINIF